MGKAFKLNALKGNYAVAKGWNHKCVHILHAPLCILRDENSVKRWSSDDNFLTKQPNHVLLSI